MSYTNAQLVLLAQNSPKELAKLLTSDKADKKLLIEGVEILSGETVDETIILPVLRSLLRHTNALVREGAVFGVAAFYDKKQPPQDIMDRLKVISTNDPSYELKAYTKDLLEGI